MADDSPTPLTPKTPQAAFFEALSELQCDFALDETLETAIRKATALGFSFQSWVDEGQVFFALHHLAGHSMVIRVDHRSEIQARDVVGALLGLPSSLGVKVAPVAAALPDPEPAPQAPASPPVVPSVPEPAPPAPPVPEPEEFDLGEDSLASDPDPDPNDDPSTSTQPLTAQEKEGLLAMLRAMEPPQRKAAIVKFRKAFNIPATITRNGDAITEVRHRAFLTRLIDEAENIPSP